ncbi:hypothetical protein JZ751_015190, partial [Albula glossodonta]
EDVIELNRRLCFIDCQLRKSEHSRRNLEMSNKKLLGFAQNVHRVLSSTNLFGIESGSAKSSPGTDTPDTPPPVPDPAGQLAAEAKELVDTVCSLTSEEVVPGGSEGSNPGPGVTDRYYLWPQLSLPGPSAKDKQHHRKDLDIGMEDRY